MSHCTLSFAVFLRRIASVNAILCEIRLNGLTASSHATFGDCQVGSAGVVFFELLLQMVFGPLSLGEHQQSRRFPIQSVNDKEHLRGEMIFDVLK